MKRILVILAMLVAMNASAQWQPDVRLTNNPANSWTSLNNAWCVASSGSIVHVVWMDDRDNNKIDIYYKRSTDAGVSWGADIRISNGISHSGSPAIAVSGDLINVVWIDNRHNNYEIYYKRSTNAGISWEVDTRLTFKASGIISQYPSVAVSGSVVSVVWSDERDGNDEIYYKRSTDAGVSWGTDIRLTNNSNVSIYPSVAVFGSVVHVVWEDARDGVAKIYYKRSTDAGLNWGADTRLTFNTGYANNPSIAIYGSVVNVVWHDDRDGAGNSEIYYKRSTDAGVTWGTDTRVTYTSNTSNYPSIAASDSVIHVVWREDYAWNLQIYYIRSTDGGINWGADTRLSNNILDANCPSISISGSVVHVVWLDDRDGGNPEIYYKRNPTGNLVGVQNISTETTSKYSLSQNYPNPFNPITNVKFSIVNSGDVKLIVYDIMGKEVQTLVNERLQPGTYEAAFDGSMLNSGVYFYKLIIRHGGSSTNTFSETKKMLLIK